MIIGTMTVCDKHWLVGSVYVYCSLGRPNGEYSCFISDCYDCWTLLGLMENIGII